MPGAAARAEAGTLSTGISVVSCRSAGNCSAGGQIVVPAEACTTEHVFVVSEVSGTRQPAQAISGVAAIGIDSLSCASAGNCSAGGTIDTSSNAGVFVASETNGRWQPAQVLPGLAALNTSTRPPPTPLTASTSGSALGSWNTFVADQRS